MRSVKFQLYKPMAEMRGSDRRTPAWLHELRNMRSNILYANGRRPAFGPGGNHFGDACPRDHHSFHITARVGEKLVGCLRGLPLSNGNSNALLDDVMGPGKLDQSLAALQVRRDHCIEVSRFILDSEFRASNIARHLVASIGAVGWQLGVGMIVAGLGTCDYQDRFIARFGGKPLPHSELVPAPDFDDYIRPMYAWASGSGLGIASLAQHMHGYFFGQQQMVPTLAATG
jgi:hypothetical protein